VVATVTVTTSNNNSNNNNHSEDFPYDLAYNLARGVATNAGTPSTVGLVQQAQRRVTVRTSPICKFCLLLPATLSGVETFGRATCNHGTELTTKQQPRVAIHGAAVQNSISLWRCRPTSPEGGGSQDLAGTADRTGT
jgi:hypothetical protein